MVLDTLEQHAADRGASHPSMGEAWSLRAHGLGERATYRWAAGFAAVAVVAFLAATGLFFGIDATPGPEADIARQLLGAIPGPLASVLSAVVLLHRAGWLSAPAALVTATSALPACGLTALAAASWVVGFDEADAGLGQSWFASSTTVFFLLGWIAGTFCLAALVNSIQSNQRTERLRPVHAIVLAAPLALVLGALIVMAHPLGAIGAVVLLVMALRSGGKQQREAPRKRPWAAVPSSQPVLTTALTRRKNAATGVAAMMSVVLGLACVLFAFTGSSWAPMDIDSTRAMNFGLAGGALVAIPATFAAGMVLSSRFGSVMNWSALICSVSLFMEAVAQLSGVEHPLQWPLTLIAATLMGFALALPIGALVPGGRWTRLGVTAALGLAGSIIGLLLVTTAAFIAPIGTTALLARSLTSLSGPRQQPNSLPDKPPSD